MNLNDLLSFVATAELGTITAAAEAVGVPKSTISRRISRLENELGVELVRRRARSLALTEDGRHLFERSAGSLRELQNIEQELVDSESKPTGNLVITAPQDFGRVELFSNLLLLFKQQYPQVNLKVRLEERVVDLIQENVDVGLRAHGDLIPGGDGLMSRTFQFSHSYFFASPAYLEAHGMPETPEDISSHTLVAHTAFETRSFKLENREKSIMLQLPKAGLQANDFLLVETFLKGGAGLGLLPEFAAKGAEKRGQLVRVLPEWSIKAGRLSLVWPASRHLAPRVRAFLQLATEYFGELGRLE